MAKKRNNQFFWVSYSDLMTSLFFIMLVLYVLSFVLWKQNMNNLKTKTDELENVKDSLVILAEKYKIIETVEKNLEPLKKDDRLFKYDKKYKRYQLAFDVTFKENRFKISSNDLKNYHSTIVNLTTVSKKLKEVIAHLEELKKTDTTYNNISYLLVISGSASDLPGNSVELNYILSFKRAYYLYKYWKENLNIDFDDERYHNLIDFQIAGNGIGGVGRFPKNSINNYASERKNQRFIINIIPKIGEIK